MYVQELEEQRRQSREAQKEKLMAVARAKEQTREQGSLELEKVKEKVRQVNRLLIFPLPYRQLFLRLIVNIRRYTPLKYLVKHVFEVEHPRF